MTIVLCKPDSSLATQNFHFTNPDEVFNGELVRGHDLRLLEQFIPVVLDRSLTLDLSAVDRLDAAGITALLTLYRTACDAGNRFRVTKVSPHVQQILSTVGLDRILISHNAVPNSQSGSHYRWPAA